jgi:hypothetical protein
MASRTTKTETVQPNDFPGQASADEVEAYFARKEVAENLSQTFTQEELANVDTFADAMALATQEFGGVVNAHEDKNLGTGFRLTDEEDKFRLIGVPLLLLDWRFNPGDFGDEYISIHAVQQNEDGSASKLVLNDGGTGICRDLREYTEKTGRKGGLFVRRGLRVSEYPTIADGGPDNGKPAPKDYTGKTGKGKTFYLNFSA